MIVEIVEVGLRDGFQGIGPFIPTASKLDFVRRLAAAGLRRIEIGAMVSSRALPQMRDTPELLAQVAELRNVRPQVLVPTEIWGRRAVDAGARELVFVLSVSEAHNRANVRRHPLESTAEYYRLIAAVPRDVRIRLDVATAFDCPYDGRVDEAAVIALLDRLVTRRPDAEICLCDTTGRADPQHVRSLFDQCLDRYPDVCSWALHAHDTYGLGAANVHSAFLAGVRVFDAAFAGLGGCPFAPGATGNVATEDLAWMFDRMGVGTGIDISKLAAVAIDGAAIPGGTPGGRVRLALASGRPCLIAGSA
ncbi:hydroxymethylglutaryl-CoA lyase [Burkholderia cenocepacia]|nr:hydroxymethylglutaryl-CoA lyase [Burkholderia cenocepacia]RQU56997.1 hydroxymethylglutaryl-CoA lyase [Burkholderia cenocepacia]